MDFVAVFVEREFAAPDSEVVEIFTHSFEARETIGSDGFLFFEKFRLIVGRLDLVAEVLSDAKEFFGGDFGELAGGEFVFERVLESG